MGNDIPVDTRTSERSHMLNRRSWPAEKCNYAGSDFEDVAQSYSYSCCATPLGSYICADDWPPQVLTCEKCNYAGSDFEDVTQSYSYSCCATPLGSYICADDWPPQVETCGYANETPLGSFLHSSLCQQIYRSHFFSFSLPLPLNLSNYLCLL